MGNWMMFFGFVVVLVSIGWRLLLSFLRNMPPGR
jgi:hypothetical protein